VVINGRLGTQQSLSVYTARDINPSTLFVLHRDNTRI